MTGLLEGRVVLVSGVGPGLGRETAAAASREGASVVLGDLEPDRLEGIRRELDPSGQRSAGVRLDITDEAACQGLVDLAGCRFGRLDGVVHVAAADRVFGGLLDGSLDDWDLAAEVNVKGTLRLTKAAVPLLRESGGGSVVVIGSVAARKPSASFVQLAYGASKAALESVVHYLSRELGPDGIRVNDVSPGFKWGPVLVEAFGARADELGVSLESLMDPIAQTLSLRRFAGDQDVANAVVFFLSDLARNVTGQTLFVDGGELLH